MDTTKAQELLAKHRTGTLTPEEKALLESWYNDLSAGQRPAGLPAALPERQWEDFEAIRQAIKPRSIRIWPGLSGWQARIAAAASILLALSFGAYFILHKKQPAQTADYKYDIAPGHNQATLTLAGGKKIILTKGLRGLVAMQGRTSIQASAGNIVYKSRQENNSVSYNTLSTARGEQSPYPLVLADGTRVWLNAESSITFPTAFTGSERTVSVSGEAYFEVKHDSSKPFRVKAGSQVIEDIGTQFDVKAYSDEPAATTLVQGSVKVNKLILLPGQQCDGRTVKEVNTAQYIAWKNGDFYFNNDSIRTVMRQLARWYNIDVQYEGPQSTEGFNAIISREKNISVVLRALERTRGVHFKIEALPGGRQERRVTVIE